MGSGPSAHQPHHDMLADHHQYPDMNMIFKGIPKMIQVADDMHRMTDYIMDLRNMTIGLIAISAIGIIGFLILRIAHGRNSRNRRKRSYMRHVEDGGYGPGMSRYYFPSQYAPEPWERPKSTFSHHSHIDDTVKKPLDSRNNSPETKPNGSLSYKPFSNEESSSPDFEKKPADSSLPQSHLSHHMGPQKV